MVEFYYVLYRESYSGTSQYTLKGLKSVHYTAQSNSEDNIRYGSIYSTRLEIEVYYTDHPKIAVGEIINLAARRNFNSSFEEQSSANTYLIDDFEVYEVKEESKNTYKVVAYDGLKRLDIDYSARLRELNDNGSFPMTIADLLTDVATVAGLTISITGFGTLPPESLSINSFYSDNITCRDIMSWYVELVGGVLIFGTFNNNIIFVTNYATTGNAGGYLSKSKYIISPTDQTTYYDDNNNELIPVFYKQDGLKKFNTVVQPIDQVVIVKSDGSLYARYPYIVNNPTNVYYVSGNPLVDLIQDTANSSYVANRLKTSLDNVFSQIGTYPYKTAEIALFPFRFPFDRTSIVTVEDIDGNRWRMPVMTVDVTDEEVRISSYGNETYDPSTGAYDTADQKTTSLDIRVNNIDSDKVSKSGDTMTGGLTLDGSDLSGVGQHLMLRIDGNKKSKADEIPSVSSNSPYGSISMYDLVGYRVFYNECVLNTNGRVYCSYIVARRTSNGTNNTHGFYMGINTDGSRTVTFPTGSKDAWLEGLGFITAQETTVANILSAGTDVTITSASFDVFGRVAQLYVLLKRTSAVTGSTTVTTLGTLASGKHPCATAMAIATQHPNNTAHINTNGQIRYYGTITANENIYILATYLLP